MPDAACVELLYLPHSIPRRRSGVVPYGPHIGCTGGPGHRVAGHCTVDGSNESRWWILAPRSGRLRFFNCPIILGQDHHRGALADYLTQIFLVILPNVPSRRSINDSRNRPNRCRCFGSPYHRNHHHAPQKQEEDPGRRILTLNRYGLIPAILSFIRYNPVRAVM